MPTQRAKGKPAARPEPEYPWEQLPKESARAYANFCTYRDLGADRSLAKAAKVRKLAPSTLENQSSAYDWVARVAAYDVHVEREARLAGEERHVQQLEALRERAIRVAERHVNAATALMDKLARRLAKLDEDDISPFMIPQFLRAAATIAEASLNAEAQALAVDELIALLKTPTED